VFNLLHGLRTKKYLLLENIIKEKDDENRKLTQYSHEGQLNDLKNQIKNSTNELNEMKIQIKESTEKLNQMNKRIQENSTNGIVYQWKITDEYDLNYYIGKTNRQLKDRMNEHVNCARKGKSCTFYDN